MSREAATSSRRLAPRPPRAGWLRLLPLALIGASLGYLFYAAGGLGAVRDSLGQLGFWQLAGCTLFLFGDLFFDSLRYALTAWTLREARQGSAPPFGFGLGLRVSLINLYVAFVTPGAGGAPPAVAWLLERRGFEAGRGLAIALIKGLVGFYALVPLALGMLLFAPSDAVAGVVHTVLTGSGVVLGLMLVAVFLVALFPRAAARVVRALLGRVHGAGEGEKRRGWRGLVQWLDGLLQETAGDFGAFLRGRLVGVCGTFFVTFANIGMFMGLIVYLAVCLGSPASLADLAVLGALYVVLVYLSPTPGGAGIAEGAGLAMFQSILPQADAAALVIVWRTFTCYIPFLLGAVLMSQELGRRRSGP